MHFSVTRKNTIPVYSNPPYKERIPVTQKRGRPQPSPCPETFYDNVSLLLHQLLKLICHKLYLRTHDHLYAGLAWADNSGNTGGFDLFLIHLCVILDLQPQPGNTVIHTCNIFFAAKTFQNNFGYLCVVIIGKLYNCLIQIVIL